jgi:hypothetical protein
MGALRWTDGGRTGRSTRPSLISLALEACRCATTSMAPIYRRFVLAELDPARGFVPRRMRCLERV